MPDEAVAPEHQRRGRHLPLTAPTELDRRTGLGTDASPQGRHLGAELAVHGTVVQAHAFPVLKNGANFVILQDLLNFEDPLNIEAAEQYSKDKDKFQAKVREYVSAYARR